MIVFCVLVFFFFVLFFSMNWTKNKLSNYLKKTITKTNNVQLVIFAIHLFWSPHFLFIVFSLFIFILFLSIFGFLFSFKFFPCLYFHFLPKFSSLTYLFSITSLPNSNIFARLLKKKTKNTWTKTAQCCFSSEETCIPTMF